MLVFNENCATGTRYRVRWIKNDMIDHMRRTLRDLGLLVWTCALPAMAEDLRHDEMLARFRQQIRGVLSQVPNYTCLETIERSVQVRRAKKFTPLDTVLLEVSNLGGKELLSWPGARRFEDADPSSFVSGGLMGNGIFALYARNVFLHDAASIQYHGDEDLGGRAVTRFDFVVPQALSTYQIQANGTSAKAGMTGSFWIDSNSVELVRLEVRADEIPAALGIDRTAAFIDYAQMHIGDSGVLLPQAAQLNLTLLSGEVRLNDIQFSHCHEYRTESAIHFDMPDTAPAAPVAPAVETVNLPAGLSVAIELETPIDSATAHVGDLLRGHVVKDVLRKGKLVIPMGAGVTGRIRGLDRLRSPAAFELTVELTEVQWEHSTAQFYGELIRKDAGPREDGLAGAASVDGGMSGPPVPSFSPDRSEGHLLRIPGTGVLHLAGAKFHIAPGFRMNWRTLEPNQQLQQPH